MQNAVSCGMLYVCIITRSAGKAAPCSTAKRQLRAAVLTAAADRPERHTRLGSNKSCRTISMYSANPLNTETPKKKKR